MNARLQLLWQQSLTRMLCELLLKGFPQMLRDLLQSIRTMFGVRMVIDVLELIPLAHKYQTCAKAKIWFVHHNTEVSTIQMEACG